MRKDDAPRTAASDWTELSGRRVVLKCSRPTGEEKASGAEQPVFPEILLDRWNPIRQSSDEGRCAEEGCLVIEMVGMLRQILCVGRPRRRVIMYSSASIVPQPLHWLLIDISRYLVHSY